MHPSNTYIKCGKSAKQIALKGCVLVGEIIKTRKARNYVKIKQRFSWRNYSTKLRKCKGMIRKSKVRNEREIAREAKTNNKAVS